MGNTYTANLSSANGNGDVIIRGAKANKKSDAADVLTGYKYNIDIENVGFNFGSANANKEVTIASSNSNVTLSRMTVRYLKAIGSVLKSKIAIVERILTIYLLLTANSLLNSASFLYIFLIFSTLKSRYLCILPFIHITH
ncbi:MULTISPECIES: hypothetical protein [Lactobacillus]|mgnify:CR=1 FL=1|uniref:hypothetical protein n=1 Tax=Lactobacillus TaxID=1578 RepID=UPI0024930953|nr:hypothetical protein [Lactobacillus amylolyticus]